MAVFKVGDKVYCPFQSNKILTIRKKDNPAYPIRAGDEAFTRHGKLYRHHKTPSIFHATPENKTKLEEFYGIELEKPPASLEIIQAMFKRGESSIACWVSDVDENPDPRHKWVFIRSVDYNHFIDRDSKAWKYATPFDPATDKAITELPE